MVLYEAPEALPATASLPVGAAVLTTAGLHLQGRSVELAHAGDFRAFLLQTQSCIVRVLQALFDDAPWKLTPGMAGFALEASDEPPAREFVRLSLRYLAGDLRAAAPVVAWCVAVDVLVNLVGVPLDEDPEAMLPVSHIAHIAWRSAAVTPDQAQQYQELQQQWLRQRAMTGDVDMAPPVDPRGRQAAIRLPWLGPLHPALARLSTAAAVLDLRGLSDVMITEDRTIHLRHGQHWLEWGVPDDHLGPAVDQAAQGRQDFGVSLGTHRFRVHQMRSTTGCFYSLRALRTGLARLDGGAFHGQRS